MLFNCVFRSWSPGIGDPTIGGWITVLAYLVAAYFALMRASEAWAIHGAREATIVWFWSLVAGLLVFLAFNKQLDLQSAFTAAGRCLAARDGWYHERRSVQYGFIVGLFIAAFVTGGGVLFALRKHLSSLWLVLLGLFVLTVFVLIRASSFHGMDAFISYRLAGLKMNWVLEIGALLTIIAGARRSAPNAGAAVERLSSMVSILTQKSRR